ncbi:translation elongation factor G [Rickettsiales bacterium (ex Bugula neritina AB1)]|nr:translation elongation factor G [Rickettsiales bacterium (ex Bugula neritina AB1)]
MPREDLFLLFYRNIGICAHIDAGKTTASERILYYCGATYKIGEVHDGAAVMDYMTQEQERGITITSAAIQCKWTLKDKKYVINLIDTPGHVDFTMEVQRSLRVLDGAVVLIGCVEGVEPQTKTVWNQAEDYKVPRIIFVNKMDRIGADFEKALISIQNKLTNNYVVLNIPVGAEGDFSGVIDLITMKYCFWDSDEKAKEYQVLDIPDNMKEIANKYRIKLLDTLMVYDDELTEKYISGEELPKEYIRSLVRKLTIDNKIIPVLFGSAFKNKGIHQLLDAVVFYLPSPLDRSEIIGFSKETGENVKIVPTINSNFAGLVFKIVTDIHLGNLNFIRIYSGSLKKGDVIYNVKTGEKYKIGRMIRMRSKDKEDIEVGYAGDIIVVPGCPSMFTGCSLSGEKKVFLEPIKFPKPVISQKIEPITKEDSNKLATALSKLLNEDPSLSTEYDEESNSTVLCGMGELHLEIIVDRLKREHGVNLNISPPEVNYREYLNKEKGSFEYTHKKQSGGAGEFAVVCFDIERIEPEKELEFVNKIRGGAIDSGYITGTISVESGIKNALKQGPNAKYPVMGIRVTLKDGAMHPVDSSNFAFYRASEYCIREALNELGTHLLEPIAEVEVSCPTEFIGDVQGDMNRRRGRVMQQENKSDTESILVFEVPVAEMFNYIMSLRALTRGTGNYVMKVKSDLVQVPPHKEKDITKKRSNFK